MGFKLKQTKEKSHIPARLNLLFFISFLCFGALFARLGYLQLSNGHIFTAMVQRTESTKSTGSVPRGMMYDRHGRLLVGNQPELAIRYTRDSDTNLSALDMIDVAKQLASLIEIPTQDLTTRDKKDYFIVTQLDKVNSRLTKEQKLLEGSEAYEAQLSVVTDEDLAFTEGELKIIALFRKMNGAFARSTVSVKNKNVTEEEISRVSEHLGSLPGVSIGTDWQRVYPQGDLLRSIFGQVSSEERGLPSEEADELLAKGYAMNDRVGISYLEKQYEDVLRGTKSIYNVITNTADDVVENQQVYEGAKGDNLVLTIDLEFQKKIEQIAEESLRNMEQRGLNDRVYITAINVKTGDVLGIAGKRFEYDEATDSYNYEKIMDDALGAINTSYGMGSSIKPAMVSIGYQNGVITLDNNVIVDEPLKFQASPEKSSVFNRTGRVPIDDITALQKSSNIYMIRMAMALGGQTEYERDGKLTIAGHTIDILRRNFEQFGLGAKTGIDLPNETAGYTPDSNQLVSALDLSYGQFDLYTPLQLAQYVSTIANGGIRFAPRLVKEIRGTDADGNLGAVKTGIDSQVMNIVPIEQGVLERLHEGMRQVSHTAEGTARYYFMNYPITVGSKTGTAEAFYAGPINYAANQPVTNATYVGFAPYDNPEIAISVVVPYLATEAWGRQSTKIAHEVMNAYFGMQEQYKDVIDNYMKIAQVAN